MRDWKNGQTPGIREEQLLNEYIQQELDGYFTRLRQEDEGYGLVLDGMEKKLQRLEQQDQRLADALRENLDELRRMERRYSFRVGYSHLKE